MGIAASILGKDIYDLTIDDIIHYFKEQREETSALEFKSGGTKKEDIIREVAAMLNTEGGLIIIGSPREDKIPGTKIKVAKGELTPTELVQDSLLSSIGSNISPAPVGIKANSFPYNDGSVIVIEIPQSQIPPHQVSDSGAYHIRLEREVKAAPHGLVQELFFKRQRPELVGSIEIEPWSTQNDIGILFKLKNVSEVAAKQLSYTINIMGISYLNNTQKILAGYTFTNGMIFLGESLHNKPFVKGLEIQRFVQCKLTYPFCLINFTFYCDESTVQYQGGIYDTIEKAYIETFDDPPKYSSLSNLENSYRRRRKDMFISEITRTLNIEYAKPDVAKVQEYMRQLDIDFPVSYWEWIMVFDGFEGRYRGMPIDFFSSEIVYKRYISDGNRRKERQLLIGTIAGYDILIDYSKKESDRSRFIIQKYGSSDARPAGTQLEDIFNENRIADLTR